MVLMKESVLSLKGKKQHNIGLPTFKLLARTYMFNVFVTIVLRVP